MAEAEAEAEAEAGEGLGFPFASLDVGEEEDGGEGACGGRASCAGCGRPASVCLCGAFPDPPLAIRGRVIVVQHPFEAKKPLSTTSYIAKCLRAGSVDVLVGRGPRMGTFEVLRRAVSDARAGARHLFVLYPTAEARGLDRVVAEVAESPWAAAAAGTAETVGAGWRYNLVLIDGTWQQAREMFLWLRRHLLADNENEGGAKALIHFVKLGSPGAGPEEFGAEAPLRLRTEPALGCLSTLEACAGAVRALEGGSQAHWDALMAPLAALVAIQKRFDPAVRARAENPDRINSGSASRRQAVAAASRATGE